MVRLDLKKAGHIHEPHSFPILDLFSQQLPLVSKGCRLQRSRNFCLFCSKNLQLPPIDGSACCRVSTQHEKTYCDSSRSKPIAKNDVADVACKGGLPFDLETAASSLPSTRSTSSSETSKANTFSIKLRMQLTNKRKTYQSQWF